MPPRSGEADRPQLPLPPSVMAMAGRRRRPPWAAFFLDQKGYMDVSTVFRDFYITMVVYVNVHLLGKYLAMDVCQGNRPTVSTSPLAIMMAMGMMTCNTCRGRGPSS
jgi:hypothetical protein